MLCRTGKTNRQYYEKQRLETTETHASWDLSTRPGCLRGVSIGRGNTGRPSPHPPQSLPISTLTHGRSTSSSWPHGIHCLPRCSYHLVCTFEPPLGADHATLPPARTSPPSNKIEKDCSDAQSNLFRPQSNLLMPLRPHHVKAGRNVSMYRNQ